MRRLEGVRIVVTRAVHQAEELAAPLREVGAEVILLPMIEIGPPQDPEPLRNAAAHINEYDWMIFTSANTLRAFVAALTIPASRIQAQIAVVGEGTRHAAEQLGFRVSLTPAEAVAESLLEAFRAYDLNDRSILLPSAAETRDVIAPELRRRGARVQVAEAYRTKLAPQAAQIASIIFREPYPDWVTFASSSAVNHLVELIGVNPLQRVKIASIGPITSATIRRYGLAVTAEANPHTVEGLVNAI